MSNTEEYLADIGKAADELDIGLLRVEVSEVEFLVKRDGAHFRVIVRPESYRKVDGNALRRIIAPVWEKMPTTCGCSHPLHPGLICGYPIRISAGRVTCECEG